MTRQSNFKVFWKTFVAERQAVQLIKSADRLSKEEINDIQQLIKKLQKENKPSSVIIKYLQSYNDKISEYYKAKRVFDTETKDLQTESVMRSAESLDINKFQVLLSPDACPTCRAKTQNGRKVFDESEITKDGYGHRPPFHPHCYCTLIPY
jgi:hypothetical protein